jgi:MOSC domain-containing protein YiiM
VDGITPETCSECGFDARAWTVRDAVTILGELGLWWQLATDGIEPVALNQRPAPGVWSALEYGLHSALVVAVLRDGIERILAVDGCALPPPPEVPDPAHEESRRPLDRVDVVADLEREGRALATLAREAPPDAWVHLGHLPNAPVQAEAALLHAVHDATHHQLDVGRGFAAIGAGTPATTGHVVQVNVSTGGVPKSKVAGASITHRGLAGDRQADRKHHGRPFQALCLWSLEVIHELAALGHPIAPGAAGENLTLAGLDWTRLRPGARLRLGTALAELSFPAVPCAKQARWFADGDFTRISHERNPPRTRWYAWVREPGEVRTEDAVVVQP